MIYNFYELHPVFLEDGVYKNPYKKPIIATTLNTGDQDFLTYMDEHYEKELCWDDDFMDNFNINEKYYIVPDDGYDCYVFTAYKGHTFYDGAEHDERVVIVVELGLDKDKMHVI